MLFCPKCKSLLRPKAEAGKKILMCSCGFKDKSTDDIKIADSTVKKPAPKVEVVDDSNEDNTLPVTDAECSKCGHNKAYYWLVQTRSGDEPETKFLKCVKCKHTWRDYS